MAQKRKTKTHLATIHGATGRGSSLREAKTDAARRIETAFTDDWNYSPTLERFPRGEIGLVHRDLEGWRYAILWPHQTHKGHCGSGTYGSKAAARTALRRHVAQQYTDDETTGYGLDLLDEGDTAGRKEHAYYTAWQQAAAAALADGLSMDEAHAWACAHTTRAA